MFISKFIQTGVHNVDPMQNLYINVKNYFGIINDVIIIGIFFRNKDYEKIVEALNNDYSIINIHRTIENIGMYKYLYLYGFIYNQIHNNRIILTNDDLIKITYYLYDKMNKNERIGIKFLDDNIKEYMRNYISLNIGHECVKNLKSGDLYYLMILLSDDYYKIKNKNDTRYHNLSL